MLFESTSDPFGSGFKQLKHTATSSFFKLIMVSNCELCAFYSEHSNKYAKIVNSILAFVNSKLAFVNSILAFLTRNSLF